MKTSGAYDSYNAYVTLSEPIKVAPGDVVRFYASWNGGAFGAVDCRFLCAYNAEGVAVSASGSSQDIRSYTVPSGIYSIIPSFNKLMSMIFVSINKSITVYSEYFAPYYTADDGFVNNLSINNNTDFTTEYIDYTMVNRFNPATATLKKYINGSGNISDNNSYFISDYMEIRPRETLYAFYSGNLSSKEIRAFSAYDKNKTVIPEKGSNNAVTSISQSGDMAYVRISLALYDDNPRKPEYTFVCAKANPYYATAFGDSPTFKELYIPKVNNLEQIMVYLPSEICVGIGRTIELYNDLVCLNASRRFHLHYICSVGIQYERKFSITGTTTGNYPLTLEIFDDFMNRLWVGTSTVKVVSNNIQSEKKVIPIGDSLTNLKPWISEVQSLSNGKIKFIGTRGQSTLRHEGRSGFKALDFLENVQYTYDNNYQGNPNISSSANPFWNGNRFSLAYYNSNQSAYVGTADAVMLFLGTNDVLSEMFTPEQSADHIIDLIDNIRLDYESIPIFVCNTIYRSNQNGYYVIEGQSISAAPGWGFSADEKIMKFQNALKDKILDKEYNNVFTVPLSICMDREYDFGSIATAVNPRLSTVTVNIPGESIHPQEAGYLQIADVMYSSFIGHIS